MGEEGILAVQLDRRGDPVGARGAGRQRMQQLHAMRIVAFEAREPAAVLDVAHFEDFRGPVLVAERDGDRRSIIDAAEQFLRGPGRQQRLDHMIAPGLTDDLGAHRLGHAVHREGERTDRRARLPRGLGILADDLEGAGADGDHRHGAGHERLDVDLPLGPRHIVRSIVAMNREAAQCAPGFRLGAAEPARDEEHVVL